MAADLIRLAYEDFCYLTTTGRASGRAHTIEIWFALHGRTIYLLSGGGERSDWIKNVRHSPDVQVRIDTTRFAGKARFITTPEEDAIARRLIFDKYTPRDSDDLTGWARTSLPLAIDLIL